ncbi:MAG TPA: sulfurtransferase TusA family protein [Spirochaetota bacterium]|nr:sulfurtransferase TusA family protein [Spirochaetota bacterium]HPV98088.1 sulfurtransferase TusA family protein [Spirochaetota bacterium]
MADKLDMRGLSCPQPVYETKKKIEAMGSGVLDVLVDSGAARENIKRLAENRGWSVSVKEQEGEFLLSLERH